MTQNILYGLVGGYLGFVLGCCGITYKKLSFYIISFPTVIGFILIGTLT